MAERPDAKPSRPSVIFTALLVPVRMNVVKTTYSHASPPVSGTTRTYLKKGSVVDAPGRILIGCFQRNHPSATPIVICPASFQDSTNPLLFFPSRFCLSLR